MNKFYIVLLIITSIIAFGFFTTLDLLKKNSEVEQIATVVKIIPSDLNSSFGYISVSKDGEIHTLKQTKNTVHLSVGDQHDFKPKYISFWGYENYNSFIISKDCPIEKFKAMLLLFIISVFFTIFFTGAVFVHNFINKNR